jgi:hypothetical protein
MRSDNAPPPDRRPRIALGGFGKLEYIVCAPPASSAAVGEAQHSGPGPLRISLLRLRTCVLVIQGAGVVQGATFGEFDGVEVAG